MNVRLWVKRTATATLTVLAIAVAAWALANARLALIVTVAALLVAVTLNRPVSWLERHRLRRGVAIAVVMLAVVAALAGVFLLLVPPAAAQVRQLLKEGPALLARVRESTPYRMIDRQFGIGPLLAQGQERLPAVARQVAQPALAVVTAAVGGVVGLVTTLFVVAFMLASGRQLVWSALAKARPERRPQYANVLLQIERALGGYMAGLLLVAVTHAAFAGVFLAIIHVPYFLPLAVLSGVASVVPYAGTLVAGALMTVVVWANNGPGMAFATIAYYAAYHEFESHIVAPLVYRRTVRLNPLIILLSVLFMTELAGIPGALAAVPLAASLRIVIGEVLRARRERLHLPDVPPGPDLMRTGGAAAPSRQ